MNTNDELQATIAKLIRPGKGILAADESLPTIAKRFQPLSIANTDESRRAYRSLLFTAPGAEEFISGAILFEETLGQRADDGHPTARRRSGDPLREAEPDVVEGLPERAP